jgi:hypothetical protein
MISLYREVAQAILLVGVAGSSLGGILTAVLLATRMLGR